MIHLSLKITDSFVVKITDSWTDLLLQFYCPTFVQ